MKKLKTIPAPTIGIVTVSTMPENKKEKQLIANIPNEIKEFIHNVDLSVAKFIKTKEWKELAKPYLQNHRDRLLGRDITNLNKKTAIDSIANDIVAACKNNQGYNALDKVFNLSIGKLIAPKAIDNLLNHKPTKHNLEQSVNDAINHIFYGIAGYLYLQELKQGIPNQKRKNFEHCLTDVQFAGLATLINNIALFAKSTTKEQVQSLFAIGIKQPIHVTHNSRLAWLFNCLSNAQLITNTWQSTIEQNKLFAGKKGSLLTAKSLSKSLNEVNQTNNTIKQISNSIKTLKQ